MFDIEHRVGVSEIDFVMSHLALEYLTNDNELNTLPLMIDENVKDNAKHQPWSCHINPLAQE